MQNTQLDKLKQDFSGQVIAPGDELYEQASATFIRKGAPALVLRSATIEDIAMGIRYARDHSLPLSVRGGGHSFAGFGTNNGGLVIDLSSMKEIQLIHSDRRVVRIEAGATWGEVAQVLGQHQLAISSGDTKSVGVGGLTLGGGIGWMVRKYGLAIDSLLAAQVVTAYGETLRASATENEDLFWALRGGGGNFGLVTNFEFAARPVSKVFFGTIFYGLEELSAVLKGWRDTMRSASEDLTTTLIIMPPFAGNPATLMVMACYAGTGAAAVQAVGPLLELGSVLNEDLKEVEYAEVLEEGQEPPDFLRLIGKNVFVESLSDELIQALAAAGGKEGSPAISIRSLGGAMARIPTEATAYAYRQSEAVIAGVTFVPANASESELSQALKPWESIAAFGSGAYSNFQGTTTEEDIQTIYPPVTYARLAAIKARYDPENLFNQNHNIRPALDFVGVEAGFGYEDQTEDYT